MTNNINFLLLLCLTFIFQRSFAQLDNENAILGVFLDSGMVEGQRSSAEELVRKTVQEASNEMEKGSMSLRMLTSLEQTLEEDLTAVLTATDCTSLHNVAPLIAEAKKIHLAITNSGCMRVREDSTLTIPLVSGSNDVVQLITDLREKNTITWSDITIITDGFIDSVIMDQLMNRLNLPTDSSSEISVVVMDISKMQTASMKLGALFSELGPRPGEPKNRQFMAIVARNQVQTIQNIANSMQLTGPKYQWLFVVPDSHKLNYDMFSFLDNMNDGDNLAFAYNMSDKFPDSDCKNGINCYLDSLIRQLGLEYSNALKKELELYFQVSDEEWEEVKPGPKMRAQSVIKAVKAQQATIPTCSVCTQWGIQAGEAQAADRFELLDVADWKPSMGLVNFDDIFPHVTGGFRRRPIIVASVNYPPWQIISGNGVYSGLIFEIVKELGNRLNFSFVVREPEDGQWGAMDSEGNWNGMIRMVQNKEVLLGAAAFTVSAERIKVVNFTTAIDLQPYTFMIARPKELSRVLIFIKPFANDTWLFIGITVLIMGPILYIINRLTPFYDYYGINDGQGLFKLQNCSWYVYGAILQQGGTKLPIANSGRLVVAFWWIFVVVVVTTYSGNLVAFLTFPQIENAVSSLDDLLDTSRGMDWGYTKGTVLEEYFQTAEGKFGEIGKKANTHDVQNMNVYDRIRDSPYALLEWKTNLLFTMKEEFLRTDTCDFSLGREEFYYENVAMPVPRDSPYIEIFNKEIKRMQLGGLIEKWKQDFWPKKDKCSSTAYGTEGETRTVSLTDMQGSFFILFMGFLLSLVIILGELIIQRNIKSLPSTPSSTRTLVKSFVA